MTRQERFKHLRALAPAFISDKALMMRIDAGKTDAECLSPVSQSAASRKSGRANASRRRGTHKPSHLF
jgi:hypothetical protein